MVINQAKNGKKMLINYTMNKSHFDYKCKQTDSCSFIMPSKPLFPNSTPPCKAIFLVQQTPDSWGPNHVIMHKVLIVWPRIDENKVIRIKLSHLVYKMHLLSVQMNWTAVM